MKPSKILLIFYCLSFVLIFSGCATYSSSSTGEKFYHEDTPDSSKNKMYNWLEKGIHKLTRDEIVGKLGAPVKERMTYRPNFLVFGWVHEETTSKILDVGIYKYSGQMSERYMLSVVFDEYGYLDNFEVELNKEPVQTNAFTTRLLVDAAVYYYNIQQLENLMTRALDGSLDRFYNRARTDIEEVGKNINTGDIKEDIKRNIDDLNKTKLEE